MTFKPDPTFTKELAREALPDAAKAVRDIADRLAREVSAPWMPRVRGQVMVIEGSGENVTVVNDEYGGHLYEWGSIRSNAAAPLRRAVRQAGLGLRED